MATYWVSEFDDIPESPRNSSIGIQIPGIPITVQSSAYTTSEQTAAFNVNTNIVCIHSDAAGYFEFGTNPTATAASERIAANAYIYRWVPRGQSYKLAFLAE